MYRILNNRLFWIACCGIIVLQLSAAVGQSRADHGSSPVTDSQRPVVHSQTLAVFDRVPAAHSQSPVANSQPPGLHNRPLGAGHQPHTIILSRDDYRDRVQAIWTAQMLGAMMGWPFEHKVASVEWIHTLKQKVKYAPVDDDWYYEMVAIRGLEKYGIDMSVQQLGKQWLDNSAGTWGSSEQARILMSKGIQPPDCGHPRYNKLWFSIGPQFSCDVYGALAPAMPNLAGQLARKYGHINGYAEGADGGVFVAGLISLGFAEKDPTTIVRKAARLIDPASPYRKCVDQVIRMAGEGKTASDIFDEVERRWHIEYPATNNAVANGGIVAASIWFGDRDFLKTVNLAYGAADFTDADCNAANAGAVVAAMRGMKGLPADLVQMLGDSIIGDKLGKVILTPRTRLVPGGR